MDTPKYPPHFSIEDGWVSRFPADFDPRHGSKVPPPPMLVVRRGWFKTTVTERQAADLAAEDWWQREKEKARAAAAAKKRAEFRARWAQRFKSVRAFLHL